MEFIRLDRKYLQIRYNQNIDKKLWIYRKLNMEETLATMVAKRKEKGKAPQTSEAQEATPASAIPATQADIAEIYEKVMQLLLHTTTPT